MAGTRHVTTIRMSEWAQREAEWTAAGWRLVSVASFKSDRQRMARVVLMMEDEGCYVK